MSHFTKCALKMTNLAAIKKALADMQLQYTEAEQGQSVSVRGYRGDKLQAAISVDMGRYDVGVVDNQDGIRDPLGMVREILLATASVPVFFPHD